MIHGHGDDAYQYDDIRSDFSSNICTPFHQHEALRKHLFLHPELITHYPEPEAWTLEAMIAERHGIDPRCVIVTSGATEAIYLIAQTFRMKHVVPATSFSEYDDAIRLFPPQDLTHTAIWLCNPNNPTGRVTPRNVLGEMVRNYDLVIIDQSYEHYTHRHILSAKAALRHGNIVQIHSMTKTYAVPGLRLGYIVTSRRHAAALRRQMRPWSVSALAIEAGKFLLRHDELICHPDHSEVLRLQKRLSEIEGVSVLPTDTNFMLCQLDVSTAAVLKEHLAQEHKMLIRDASNFRGLTPRHFRIAAQTPEENDALVEAIKQFMDSKNNKKQ